MSRPFLRTCCFALALLLPAIGIARENDPPVIGLLPVGKQAWYLETRQPRDYLNDIAWSPDNELVACAETRGLVRIYDAASWQLVRVINDVDVGDLEWSPNGKWLATISGDCLRIWAADGTRMATTVSSVGMFRLAWSPDSERIVTGFHYRTWRIWNRDGRPEMESAAHHADSIRSLAWSPDGKQIASAAGDGSLRLWRLAEATVLRRGAAADEPRPLLDRDVVHDVPFTSLRGHKAGGLLVRWHPAGDLLASSDTTGIVRVWTAAGKLRDELPERKGIGDMDWSPNGEWLALNAPLVLWNTKTKEERQIDKVESWTRRIAWSPDSQKIAGVREAGVRLWNLAGESTDVVTGTKVSEVWSRPAFWNREGTAVGVVGRDLVARAWNMADPHDAKSWNLPKGLGILAQTAVSADWVATQSFGDRAIRYWKLDGTPGPVVEGLPGAVSLTWSSDGKLLAVTHSHGFVNLLDPEGKVVQTIDEEHGRRIDQLAWSPDGKLLATAANQAGNRIRLWRTDGTLVAKLEGMESEVRCIAWHPKGHQLAEIELGGGAQIWKADGTPGPMLRGHKAQGSTVAWSPDGKWLASMSNGDDLRIWDADGKPVASPDPGSSAVADQLLWTADSRWVAVCDQTGVRLIEPSGKAGPVLAGRRLTTRSAAWSPDGRYLACPTDDEALIVWEPATDQVKFVGLAINREALSAISPDRGLLSGDRAAFDKKYVFLKAGENGKLELQSLETFAP